jgi:uncharacterized protein (DUF433 family)
MQVLTNQGAYPMQDLLQRITIDSEICHGKPSIRGLRYPVETILQLLSSGMSTEEILEDYEDLEKEDIMASLLYASKLTEVKSIYKLDVA